MSKRFKIMFLILAIALAALGWKVTSDQEKTTYESRNETHDLFNAVNKVLTEENGPTVTLSANSPAWMKIAYKEIGQKEIVGPIENERIQQYFRSIGDSKTYRDDIADWASPFAEWSLQQIGKNGPKSMEPFAWLEWGKTLEYPEFGCIVVLSFAGLHHVGFYIGDKGDDFIEVLGGNESDSVRVSYYLKSSVQPHGYRSVP